MNHLSPEQLSAHADGGLIGRALEDVEHHLASCHACQRALDRVVRETEDLKDALAHDPGDAYFASFAERVAGRIAAAPASAPAPLAPPLGGFWSPRRLAWAGGVVAVMAGAALVIVVARQPQPDLARRTATTTESAAPTTPPADEERMAAPLDALHEAAPMPSSTATPPHAQATPPAPPAAARDRAAPSTARAAAPPRSRNEMVSPQRAYEVRRGPGGEDLPVNPPRTFAMKSNAPEPPPSPADQPGRVRKPTRAEPLERRADTAPGTAALEQAPAPVRANAPAPAPVRANAPAPALGSSRESAAPRSTDRRIAADAPRGLLCGAVVDDRGRPVVGAQVVLTDLGMGVTTDRAGRFCLTAPTGARTLSILAVGFQTVMRNVTIEAQTPDLALALQPVAVLDQPLALGGAGQSPPAPAAGALSQQSTTATKSLAEGGSAGAPQELHFRGGRGQETTLDLALAPFAQLPDSVRALARGAHKLSVDAAGRHSAAQFEVAANEWERVVRRTQGVAELEARRQLADARFRAWVEAPSPRRAMAAQEALTGYIVRAPAGAARNEAAVRLDRVRH